MHYLRENKALVLLALLIIPAFFFDNTLMTWVKENRAFRSDALYGPIDDVVKFLTHGATLIISSLLLFLVARSYNRRLAEAGKTLFFGLITAGVVVQGFKHLIGRARPRVTFNTVFIGPSIDFNYDSFPSGHTTLTFCLAYILSQFYPRYRVVFYLFAVMTGADRMLGLSHFPSDVLAGALLGMVVGRIVYSRAVCPAAPAFKSEVNSPV
ncbi:MAG: phosphatase PAP2 family protein [Nitrospirae bacterium]|nr:MAG: phosphatase PAP2 family protein [Nitrospirota bacterium]